MSILDFKEVPEANKSGGSQDRFELFARDFLEYKGFDIVEDPSRGADGGKDMVVCESRLGITAPTKIRWLVSCKHFAHSGSSVGVGDETDIIERVTGKNCSGFMGIYSTLPSSGLATRLVELRNQFETFWYDHEKIEASLLATPDGIHLTQRYFPESLRVAGSVPAKVFADAPSISCEACGRDLLATKVNDAIFVLWRETTREGAEIVREEVVDLHFCCKGACDRIVEARIRARHAPRKIVDSWDDIPDLFIPTVYISKVMAFLNQIQGRTIYSEKAFDKMKDLFIGAFPFVCRHPNAADDSNLERLKRIPAYLGGMGY
jgi:hypothetical protein